MSVRAELQEVVEWIAGLSAAKPAPKPEPLSREEWDKVYDNLEDATTKLGEARTALRRSDVPPDFPSFLVEYAGELKRQSEGLTLRANMLKRRATPDSPAKAKAKAEEEARAKAEAEREKAAEEEMAQAEAARKKAEEEARLKAMTAEERKEAEAKAKVAADRKKDAAEARAKAEAERKKDPLEKASDLLKTAQGTVERAHGNVGVVEHPDAIATAFEGELELLAEMTLTLLQQLEEYKANSGSAANPGPILGRAKGAWKVLRGKADVRPRQNTG